MNDTVGTMMTCSMRGEPCEVALIVGEQWAPCVPGEGAGVGGAVPVLTPITLCRHGHQQLLHG